MRDAYNTFNDIAFVLTEFDVVDFCTIMSMLFDTYHKVHPQYGAVFLSGLVALQVKEVNELLGEYNEKNN